MPPMYIESWIRGPASINFYTRTYNPYIFPSLPKPKAVVVFVHGFIEHIGRYDHVFRAYASRGIAVFAFDQRGFGRTASNGGWSVDAANKAGEGAEGNPKYGKTSWKDQLSDIEWAVGVTRETWKDAPVFLHGQSMGGGLVLAFATRTCAPPSLESVSAISGIISTSPLILLPTPVPRPARWIARYLSMLAPSLAVPAPASASHFTRDPRAQEAFKTDAWVGDHGTLRGLVDMLDGGEKLLEKDYANYPPHIPLFLAHGTAQKITSHDATKAFYDKVPALDKVFSSYDGGHQDLQFEPGGMKERFVEECITWIEARVKGPTPSFRGSLRLKHSSSHELSRR